MKNEKVESYLITTVGEYEAFWRKMHDTIENQAYLDRVWRFVNKMSPGHQFEIAKLCNPDRLATFVGCLSLYQWVTNGVYTKFSADYQFFKRVK